MRTKTNLTNLAIALLLAILFCVVDAQLAKNQKVEAKAETQATEAPKPTKAPKPTEAPKITEVKEAPKTQKEEIEAYIREVFGKDADKALLLLKGKGEATCAENRNLNPYAKHENIKNGIVYSTDFGLFQINDKYHPVFKLNLHKDWKANVDYAYKMFKNDGYSFKRWTCGRYWGF